MSTRKPDSKFMQYKEHPEWGSCMVMEVWTTYWGNEIAICKWAGHNYWNQEDFSKLEPASDLHGAINRLVRR